MERKKRELKGNVGSYNESCECGSASTKGYVAYFVVQKCPKILKKISEKRKTAEFRKRISAKTAVFFGF